jgi:hypothetical protein
MHPTDIEDANKAHLPAWFRVHLDMWDINWTLLYIWYKLAKRRKSGYVSGYPVHIDSYMSLGTWILYVTSIRLLVCPVQYKLAPQPCLWWTDVYNKMMFVIKQGLWWNAGCPEMTSIKWWCLWSNAVTNETMSDEISLFAKCVQPPPTFWTSSG